MKPQTIAEQYADSMRQPLTPRAREILRDVIDGFGPNIEPHDEHHYDVLCRAGLCVRFGAGHIRPKAQLARDISTDFARGYL